MVGQDRIHLTASLMVRSASVFESHAFTDEKHLGFAC